MTDISEEGSSAKGEKNQHLGDECSQHRRGHLGVFEDERKAHVAAMQ